MRKWIISAIAAGLVLQNGLVLSNVSAEESVSTTTEKAPSIIGDAGVTIDANSGQILYTKNADKKMFPASITKVMTAILVDEYLDENDTITISKNAASQEHSNSQLIFEEGEKVSKDDAFEALMIVSANDAAFALGEAIGGSIEGFADMMNKKAKELGATNTHFETPNGLPNPEHYTTAHDMALIGLEASKHPDIVNKMAQREAEIVTDKRTISITSTNTIPAQNPRAIGGKTGYTDAAQHTLLEILKEEDKEVISVTLHSTKQGKYTDMNTMSEYAFSKITTQKLFEKGELYHTFEMNGKEYPLTLKEAAVISVADELEETNEEIVWNNEKKKYNAGETVAWLSVSSKGNEIGKFPLVTDKTFAPNNNLSNGSKEDSNLLIIPGDTSDYTKFIVGSIFAVPTLTFLALFLWDKRKRSRSRMNLQNKAL